MVEVPTGLQVQAPGSVPVIPSRPLPRPPDHLLASSLQLILSPSPGPTTGPSPQPPPAQALIEFHFPKILGMGQGMEIYRFGGASACDDQKLTTSLAPS